MAEMEIIIEVDRVILQMTGLRIDRVRLQQFCDKLSNLDYLSDAKVLPYSDGVAVRLYHPRSHKQLRHDAQTLWDRVCIAKK